MTTFVLDTSVAAAWYLPEAFAREARLWQSRLLDGRARLFVPTLHFWEFANVLRSYVHRSEMEPDLARRVYVLHLEAPLDVVDPERADVLAVALEFGATAYDAVFIALARQLGAPLLTAERSSAPWVRKLGRLARTVRPG